MNSCTKRDTLTVFTLNVSSQSGGHSRWRGRQVAELGGATAWRGAWLCDSEAVVLRLQPVGLGDGDKRSYPQTMHVHTNVQTSNA